MRGALLLDTNILLLYLVGLTDRALIGQFKRLRMFSSPDFDRLLLLAHPFGRIILTPNTISETSNLLPDPNTLAATTLVLTRMRRLLEQHGECYVPSTQALQRQESNWLGVTDAALMVAAKEIGATLLTADAQLYVAAVRAGVKATNFGDLLRVRR